MRSRRTRRIAPVVIAAGAWISSVSPAAARLPPSTHVAWKFHDPGAPGMSNFGTCAHPGCIAFDGGVVVTSSNGVVIGTTRYRGLFYPGATNELAWEVNETLSLRRAVCGQTSLHWFGHGTATPSNTGPDGRFPMYGTLDLSRPVGHLALVARAAYATPPGGQDGTITGDLRC